MPLEAPLEAVHESDQVVRISARKRRREIPIEDALREGYAMDDQFQDRAHTYD
jgi:hypothetical protein